MTQQLEQAPVPQPAAAPTSGWTTPIRVVAGVAATVVLVAGAASAVGFFMISNGTERVNFSEPVTRVEVTVGAGDVKVRTAAAGQGTSVTSRTSSSFRTAHHSESVTNGVLAVKGTCRGSMVVSDFCSVNFEISVQAGTSVKVDTSSGDVSVLGTGAPVTVLTRAGDIHLDRTGAPARAKTNSGDVKGLLLAGGDVSAATNAGNVKLEFATSPTRVKASTNTGDVDVLVPNDQTVYRIDADVNVGDRRLDVPTASNAERVMILKSSAGDIHVGTK
jgi:DUF4097 and DUF4098 domain-containing protein YvlB